VQGNMIVPIDLLEPILDDMTKLGRPNRPPRPWLGVYATQTDGHIVIGGLADNGPAHKAGIRQGDVVLEVAGQRVSSLADLFRKIWSLGSAGTEIPLTVAREARSSPSIEGHASSAARLASSGSRPAPMTPRMTPTDLRCRVRRRVSTSVIAGTCAAANHGPSPPVARQFEYVWDSSRTTTPAICGAADSGSSEFIP